MEKENPTWLKFKGYLHIVGHLNLAKNSRKIIAQITNPLFVCKYGFYPLIHAVIEERRYKHIAIDSSKRAHTYKDENGSPKKNLKQRPLHYANHMDALIFGYYAELLQEAYERKIASLQGLNNCIIAYRKIPSEIEGKHKSTIHFAHEIFEEIKQNAFNHSKCVVLTFDIKSFFSSLDHTILKTAWADLLGLHRLPNDHYNVFKAATLFSYIYLDELKSHKKESFDESDLARIRNKHGINAFFDSPKSFRDKVKNGSIKLHKFPFRNKKTKIPVGIPQGLPISAVLANLYLLSFDEKIYHALVKGLGAYYRRYSDDIIIVCKEEDAQFVEEFIMSGIQESKVEISPKKTEKFIFREMQFGNKSPRLTSIKCSKTKELISAPLNYLGFEFNGQKALIKSANLAKFYRRMIYSVKSKAKRAIKSISQNPEAKLAVYRRQLYRLYTTRPLNNVKIRSNIKVIEKNKFGSFTLRTIKKDKLLRSNYLTYVDRASEIMKEPAIKQQVRKHKAIFNQAIKRYLK